MTTKAARPRQDARNRQTSDLNVTEKKEDHRVRVAMARREKMRKRLLRSIMASLGKGKRQIDDVIDEAGVSRATFYKYFSSLDDAISAVYASLREELDRDIRVIVERTDNPLARIVTGVQIFLLRSVTDPIWGAFASRAEYIEADDIQRQTFSTDLALAKEAGLAHFDDVEAATTVLLGSTLDAVRYLSVRGVRKRSYVEEVSVLMLCALGVPLTQAQEIVRERVIFIRGLAPDELSWWRDPWI